MILRSIAEFLRIAGHRNHANVPDNQPQTDGPPHPQLPHQMAPNAESHHPVDQLSPTHSKPAFSFPLPFAGAPNPEKTRSC